MEPRNVRVACDGHVAVGRVGTISLSTFRKRDRNQPHSAAEFGKLILSDAAHRPHIGTTFTEFLRMIPKTAKRAWATRKQPA